MGASTGKPYTNNHKSALFEGRNGTNKPNASKRPDKSIGTSGKLCGIKVFGEIGSKKKNDVGQLTLSPAIDAGGIVVASQQFHEDFLVFVSHFERIEFVGIFLFDKQHL